MARLAGKAIGYGCIGAAYQSIRKTIKSKSIIKSGFYSTLGGLFVMGAHRLLEDTAIVQKLEQLLAQESPEIANNLKGLLSQKFPSLEGITKKELPYSTQELKRQIMKEKGYDY